MRIEQQPDAPAVRRLRLSPAPGREQIVLSEEGVAQLQAHFDEAKQDEGCRVIVLESSDGSFCEGMDLSWVSAKAGLPEEAAALTESLELYAKLLVSMNSAPQVVIAQVDGDVRAGGMGLMATADLIVATASSQFGLPEVLLGLIPAMVYPLLQARMGPQRTKRWALLAETLDATQAQETGLVDVVVADQAAMHKQTKTWLRQLLRMHPEAIDQCKQFHQTTQTMPLAEGIVYGAHTTSRILQQPARREGIQAFLDGEPLPWFARYRSKGT